MSFADRLARGRAGDRAALEELFAPWRPLLRLQAGQRLGAELSARVDPVDARRPPPAADAGGPFVNPRAWDVP
jgi:hypothetical protein